MNTISRLRFVVENIKLDETVSEQLSQPFNVHQFWIDHIKNDPTLESSCPIKEARKKKNMSVLDHLSMNHLSGFATPSIMPHLPSIMPHLLRNIHSSPRTYSINNANTKISVGIEKLLHTRRREYSDMTLVFLKEGTHNFLFNVMCEEYEKPECIEFEITI